MTPEPHAPASPRSALSGTDHEVAGAFGAAASDRPDSPAPGQTHSPSPGEGAPLTAAPQSGDLPDGRSVSPVSADAVDAADTAPKAARSRYSMGSLPNILRSMFVIGLLVLGLVAVIPRIGQVDRPAIDALAKAQLTASQTTWPIELPTGLGEGWKPTVASYAPGTDKVPTFTTVWVSPDGSDIALKQAVKVTDSWVARSVDDGTASGQVAVSGRTFERFADPSRRQLSYVVRGAGTTGLTLAATTTGTEAELKTFVAALQKVTPGPG